tara:strand:+ start:9600 stop:10733 length:1134 start_codon:yes stop_codon:yes gene_type:complete
MIRNTILSFSFVFFPLILISNPLVASSKNEGITCYQNEDYECALQKLMPHATKGDPLSQRLIGRLYFNGFGVDQDKNESNRWIQLSAENGDAESQNELGMVAFYSDNFDEALSWFHMAANQGYMRSIRYLGNVYYEQSDFNNAAYWYQRLTVLDQEYFLGNKTFERLIELKSDLKTRSYWIKAIEQALLESKNCFDDKPCNHELLEFPDGFIVRINKAKELDSDEMPRYDTNSNTFFHFNHLGQYIRTTIGHTASLEKASECWKLKEYECYFNQSKTVAIEDGKADAQFNLGNAYEYGYGVEKNYQKALDWYYKSAKQGDEVASNRIGSMFEHGTGVKANKFTAYEWYLTSAKLGYRPSELALDRLCKQHPWLCNNQ